MWGCSGGTGKPYHNLVMKESCSTRPEGSTAIREEAAYERFAESGVGEVIRRNIREDSFHIEFHQIIRICCIGSHCPPR